MAACGALVLYWERGSKVSRRFAAAAALLVVWSAGRGLARLVHDPGMLGALWQWTCLAGMLSLPLLYQFSVIMVRTDARRTAFIRLNWLVGALFAAATVGTGTASEAEMCFNFVTAYPAGALASKNFLGGSSSATSSATACLQ